MYVAYLPGILPLQLQCINIVSSIFFGLRERTFRQEEERENTPASDQ